MGGGEGHKGEFHFCPQWPLDTVEEFTVEMILSILDWLHVSFYRAKHNMFKKSIESFST